MKDFADVVEQEQIENHGVWVPFGDGEESTIMVAAAGNPAFEKRRVALEKRYRKSHNIAFDKPIKDEEDSERLYRQAAFDTLVKGWRGPAFDFDQDGFPALQARMQESFGIELEPPPVPPEGGKGPLPFNEANMVWYMGLSKRFRRTIFANASSDDTFNKQNLDILGKA